MWSRRRRTVAPVTEALGNIEIVVRLRISRRLIAYTMKDRRSVDRS